MFRFAAVTLLSLAWASLARAADPAAAIVAAREAISARDYDRAVALLQGAMPDASALVDQKKRDDAVAALHFYSALALSGKGADTRARDEVRQFLRFHPGTSSLDSSKYPANFVALFDSVMHESRAGGPQSFEHYYPAFGSMHSGASRPIPLATWGTSAEIQLLASAEERRQWEILRDDDARREFIANFWVSRDPNPSTPENEWRNEFNRRVVFADETFGRDDIRGSATDRGRVLVLLGPPARVYLRNIGQRRGGFLQVNGTEEKWVYFKGQLPTTLSQNEIDFRFLDQPAYGDHVLEKDFLPLHALAEARKSLTGTTH